MGEKISLRDQLRAAAGAGFKTSTAEAIDEINRTTGQTGGQPGKRVDNRMGKRVDNRANATPGCPDNRPDNRPDVRTTGQTTSAMDKRTTGQTDKRKDIEEPTEEFLQTWGGLFSNPRQGRIAYYFYVNRDVRDTQDNIAKRLYIPYSSLRKTLSKFVAIGLLESSQNVTAQGVRGTCYKWTDDLSILEQKKNGQAGNRTTGQADGQPDNRTIPLDREIKKRIYLSKELHSNLHALGFQEDQVQQALAKRIELGLDNKNISLELEFLNAWASDEEWLKKRMKDPVNSLFVMLRNGVHRPTGYKTKAELFNEYITAEAARQEDVKFEIWEKSLSTAERKEHLKSCIGPETIWLKNIWKKQNS